MENTFQKFWAFSGQNRRDNPNNIKQGDNESAETSKRMERLSETTRGGQVWKLVFRSQSTNPTSNTFDELATGLYAKEIQVRTAGDANNANACGGDQKREELDEKGARSRLVINGQVWDGNSKVVESSRDFAGEGMFSGKQLADIISTFYF